MAGRERCASAGAQIREIRGFHDGARQTRPTAKEHDQGRHTRDRSIVVLKKIGDYLDPEAPRVLEVTGVENSYRRRCLAGDESTQAFDGLSRREQREGLRLRFHGISHVEAAPNIGLAEK